MMRIGEWLDIATIGTLGDCDNYERDGVTCFGGSQDNRSWAKLDPSKFCDSCLANWHARHAARLLKRLHHAAIEKTQRPEA